ncbi:MAG TPA: hypothetical protein VIV40_03185, partial [Kofleriaceae bacterium]
LLLVTNGGARYLTIAGPSTPTEEEIAALKLALELAREVRCTRPAREVFEGLGTSLEWLGDPAPPRGFPGGDPPEGPWTHGWHVEVGGAGPWAELVIEDRHGNPLATSSLDAGFGEVTIGVAATELRARLVGRSNALPLAHAAGRSLSVGQALFEHVGELQLSDRCVGLSVRSSARGMLLEAATTAGVLHYDVSDPLAMRLVSANVEQPPRDELHVGEHASHGTPMLLPNRRGRRLAFVRRPRGGGVLVDISVPNQPVLRARYEVTPWHVGLVRVGTQYARLDDTQHRIVFYQRRWTSQPVVAMANA